MAGTADVVVRFLADTGKLQSDIKDVEGSTNKLGETFKGFAKTAATALGAIGVAKIASDAVSMASDFADQFDAVRVVFGDSAKTIQQWSATTAESMGLARTDALKTALALSAAGKGMGLAGDDLAQFTIKLAARAGDVASLFGGTAQDAVEAFTAALRGEMDPIEKYGVFLNEAAIQAAAVSHGIVQATGDTDKIKAAQIAAMEAQIAYTKAVKEHGAESDEAHIAAGKLELAQGRVTEAVAGTVPQLTDAQKKAATYAAIMDQTAVAQGNFADTSDSAANKTKIMKAKLDDAEVALGTALLPIVETITPWIAKLADAFAGASGPIQNATIALAGFGAVAIAIGGPVGLIVAALGAIVVAAYLVWTNWDKIWGWIQDHPAYAAVIAILVPFIAQFVLIILALRFLWENWSEIWGWIKGAATDARDWIVGAYNDVIGFFQGLPGKIRDALSDLGDILVSPFRWAWDQITNIANDIKGAFDSAIDHVRDAWNGFVHVWNGIEIHVPGVKIPLGPDIGGFTIGLPNLKTLDTGGIVTGPTLALLAANNRPEAVIPLDRFGGGGGTYYITVNVPIGAQPADVGAATVDAIRAYERLNGRSWRS